MTSPAWLPLTYSEKLMPDPLGPTLPSIVVGSWRADILDQRLSTASPLPPSLAEYPAHIARLRHQSFTALLKRCQGDAAC